MSALVLASLLFFAQAQQAASCVLSSADKAWLDELIDTWRQVARTSLRIEPDPLPLIVIFNESCVWRIGSAIDGAPHTGSIQLPDGEMMPVRLATFAGTYGAGNQPYLVMAMASIWRADANLKGDPGLPLLMRAVFAHEMTHTVQAKGIGPWLDEVEKLLNGAETLDDDFIQSRYEKDPEFRAAFAAERALLYQAVEEENPSVRRALLSTAVSMMDTRRRRYFSGENAVYADLEDIFLNMEGLGNWVAYQVARRQGMTAADARNFIRRGRTRWSQDEGLAAFLLIDALIPDWRERVLKGRPASVFALLAEGARK